KPLTVPQKSEAVREHVTQKEGEQVRELIQSKGFQTVPGRSLQLICLDESGKALRTTEWARILTRAFDSGATPVFLIGSGLGLSDSLLQQAQLRLSFGPQTLSHELARLVLLEQLYRAASLLAGHPYHNEG